MQEKTVLITGGLGFLGRATALCFKRKGYKVVGIGTGCCDLVTSQTYGFDHWLDSIVTMSGLMTLDYSFDVIVHCAGNGSVGYSITNPFEDYKKNVDSTVQLLEYMRLNQQGAVLIYPSSAGVYGAKDDTPIREVDSLNPISPYGFNKRVAEELCESYSKSFGLSITIVRFFSIYGPGLTKQLLWDASIKLTSAKNDAEFWGTGDETRDWIHVDDASRMILTLAEFKSPFCVFNGAGGKRLTVMHVLSQLKEHLGATATIVFNGIVRQGDPRFYHADISKITQLGWHCTVPLDTGLKQYALWYKAHMHAATVQA